MNDILNFSVEISIFLSYNFGLLYSDTDMLEIMTLNILSSSFSYKENLVNSSSPDILFLSPLNESFLNQTTLKTTNQKNSQFNTFLVQPAFNLTLNSTRILPDFKKPLKLQILTEDSYKSTKISQNICLGKLKIDEKKWECIDISTRIEGSYRFFFIQTDGIYAIILDPLSFKEERSEECAFACKYPVVIGMIVVLGLLFIVALFCLRVFFF